MAMAVRGVVLLLVLVIAVQVRAGDVLVEERDLDVLVSYAGEEDVLTEERVVELFEAWLRKFSQSYANDLSERAYRLRVFRDNLQYLLEHNKKGLPYKLGLNRFADLTNAEYRARYLGTKLDREARRRHRLQSPKKFRYADVEAPDAVDWRDKRVVTKVKDQASCGSCWAFSAIASVEGINAIATGELISLSEQELVDCDTSYNQGCNGGLMDYAFEFILKNGGIDTDKDYPYTGYDGRCDQNKKNAHVVTIDDYEDVPYDDEASLKKAVAKQPISVAIEASGRDFQLYHSGVFTGACGTDLDHGVTAVGYGTDADLDYWIVKNSWGAFWGEKGYIRMQRSANVDFGTCGILIEPSYAVKDSANPPNPGPTPPSPTPPEIICDEWRTCPTSSTCCCTFPVGKMCLAWGCCGLESATCCEDHYHCCPHEFPICNLQLGLCLKGSHDIIGVELMDRTPAKVNWAAIKEKFGRKVVTGALALE